MLELNRVHQGNSLTLLKQIDDETMDCCVTSPPYYGLRAYGTEPQIWLNGKPDCGCHQWVSGIKKGTTGGVESKKVQTKGTENFQITPDSEYGFCINCGAWRGELGLEPTFELYLEHLWQIFDEVKRVLKKTGTCFVNMGDSYGGHRGEMRNPGYQGKEEGIEYRKEAMGKKQNYNLNSMQKSLMQIPSRFSIGMTDRGWILRNKIVWYKRNCMPSSAKDRFTVDFEEIFFFVKSQKYFFEQQFEPFQSTPEDINKPRNKGAENFGKNALGNGKQAISEGERDWYKYGGRNKRCVWDITPQPFSEAHFAVYPQALVEPMIKSGCPEEICNKCGKAREKVYEKQYKKHDKWFGDKQEQRNGRGEIGNGYNELVEIKETGMSDCGCNEGFHPGIVLDPFGGAGTTGIVAKKLKRDFILLELQQKYIEIADRRFMKEFGLFNPLQDNKLNEATK